MTDKEYALIRIKTKRKTMTDYKKLCEELRSIEKHEIIDRGDLVGYRNREPSSREHDAADAIEELQVAIEQLQADNKQLHYTLWGVMHSVDKWLDGDELKQSEINRAADMREKTLRMVEALQAENERLRKQFEAAVEDLTSLARRYCTCHACINDEFDYNKETCTGCQYNDWNNWQWHGEQE